MSSTYLITVILSAFFITVFSITCYDCRADDSSCHAGECNGAICVKMETANLDNERRTVHKSCSDEYEETACKQSTFGSKLIYRCTCDTGAFCNGDDALTAAGLISSNSTFNSSSLLLITFFVIFFVYLRK